MENQMMCCGTARLTTSTGYGTTLGWVRADLSVFGKVWDRDEAPARTVPPTTGEFDLFLDASNLWRRCYIAARVESAGQDGEGEDTRYHYAVSLKEGHSSGPLRLLCLLILALGLVALDACKVLGGWTGPVVVLLMLLLYFGWYCAPIRSAYRLPPRILKKLETLG